MNKNKDTVFKYEEWIGVYDVRVTDFDRDGFLDIMFLMNTNTPNTYDLALFDNDENNFKLVEKFSSYGTPIKILGTKYHFSYDRAGCADWNWVSDLFYIENFKTYRIGHISGRGCEGETRNGIFIYKIEDDKEILVKEIPREPGYYADKWDFIQNYWAKNYEKFE